MKKLLLSTIIGVVIISSLVSVYAYTDSFDTMCANATNPKLAGYVICFIYPIDQIFSDTNTNTNTLETQTGLIKSITDNDILQDAKISQLQQITTADKGISFFFYNSTLSCGDTTYYIIPKTTKIPYMAHTNMGFDEVIQGIYANVLPYSIALSDQPNGSVKYYISMFLTDVVFTQNDAFQAEGFFSQLPLSSACTSFNVPIGFELDADCNVNSGDYTLIILNNETPLSLDGKITTYCSEKN